MSAPLFTKREILVAGGVGLVGAAGISALRSDPTRPIAGAPTGRALPFEPLDDDAEVELTQASGLRAGRNDLTRIAPGRATASGVPILISGRLTNGFGGPCPRPGSRSGTPIAGAATPISMTRAICRTIRTSPASAGP
jgi:hypothetical protein